MKKVTLTAFAVGLGLTANVIAQVPSYVPTNGLVGWWPFNGNANDESGNGNNGSVNGATLTTDRFGNANKAYSFDGGDWIELNLLPAINNSNELAVSVWVKSTGTNSNTNCSVGCAQYYFSRGYDGGNGFNILTHQGNSPKFYGGVNGGFAGGQGVQDPNNTPIPHSQWNHLLLNYDGALIKLYVNGTLVGSTSYTTNVAVGNTTNAVFGRQFVPNYPYYAVGSIDDGAIWNRALSQQEVTALYNSVNCNITATATQTNVSCNGGNNGTATVSPSGGTSPYTYSWSPSGGTAATASNLAAGTYTCTVRDANQCSATKTITITQPTSLTATTTQNNVSCNGGKNGTATVSPLGGTSPYTYSWSPSGGTAATASNLAPGTYTCTIRDSKQCSSTKTVIITQPTALTATTTQNNVSCNGGKNGTATVSPTGGTSPYTYSWSPSGGTAATASNLAAGSYTCTVKDSKQCTTSKNVVITQPLPLTTNISPTTNYVKIGKNGTFNAVSQNSTANFIWQTKHVGLNWQTIPSGSQYTGTKSNSLSINNVQVNNHLQAFRVVAFSGNCSDTSSSVVLHVSDTCIVTVNDTNYVTITDTNVVTIYDTLLTTVTDTLVINTTLSLPAPNNENTILIYPNPASDHITIDNGNYSAMAGYSIKIQNNSGQQVFQSAINQKQFYLDLSKWSGNGLYFVHLIDPQNNTVTVRKIVLQ
jgi:hypothetical protein